MKYLIWSVAAAAVQGESHWGALVDKVNNNPKSTWVATMPSERVLAKSEDFKGYQELPHGARRPSWKVYPKHTLLPDDFDSRTKWPHCETIQTVRDQCGCGSCFAFGAIEAFEDRICIHSGRNVTLSVGDVIACHVDENMSCQGGNPIAVWEGVLAGKKSGDGAILDSCYPYQITPCPCNHHSANSSLPQCPPESENKDPTCDLMKKFSCQDQGIFFAESANLIPTDNMEEEIVTNGPITAAFTVYDDFLTYSHGIYQKSPNATSLGGHAIKIVGYGVEEGTKYWTVANSWNSEWGEGGFFRILRGANECYIESSAVVAGLPAKR